MSAILLLVSSGVQAVEISVPMKLDYRFIHRILLEQVYTGENNTAMLIDDKANCSKLVLSKPQIMPHDGQIRVVTAANAAFGRKIAGRCVSLPEWRGALEVFQEPFIVPGQPVIEFRVVDSKLLNKEGNQSVLTGAVWDKVVKHVHASLDVMRIDLTEPLRDIQTFVPLMLPNADSNMTQQSLESMRFSEVKAGANGVKLVLQFNIPERRNETKTEFTAQQSLTSAEALRWELAQQRWDAFLTFVVKQAALDGVHSDLRKALLQVLLDGRYDLSEALTGWHEGGVDPVRELFLKTWRRLSPILQQMETTLPGAAALRYLSFVAAADALKAMDQVSEQIGYEISADGLRRMARMLSPEHEDDPLIYHLEVDNEMRQLFDFGPPLPLPVYDELPDINGDAGFFFPRAWASDNPRHALIKKLNHWVPQDNSDVESYLPMVADLLNHVIGNTIHSRSLTEQYHNFFRHIALATAWQESCWRQFVKKGERLEPIQSPGGSVGIMQINPGVWRGFYDVSALRKDISYNAAAGNEILHHYFTDYVLVRDEHTDKRSLDSLARLTYATYSGGPGLFDRLRKKYTSNNMPEVSTTFLEKYRAIKTTGPLAVASCYGFK